MTLNDFTPLFLMHPNGEHFQCILCQGEVDQQGQKSHVRYHHWQQFQQQLIVQVIPKQQRKVIQNGKTKYRPAYPMYFYHV
jgi:hypothetical protein